MTCVCGTCTFLRFFEAFIAQNIYWYLDTSGVFTIFFLVNCVFTIFLCSYPYKFYMPIGYLSSLPEPESKGLLLFGHNIIPKSQVTWSNVNCLRSNHFSLLRDSVTMKTCSCLFWMLLNMYRSYWKKLYWENNIPQAYGDACHWWYTK